MAHTIDVRKTLNAPIEHVFEVLADHAGYAENFRGITRSSLVREGDAEPNGLGAVRAISSGPLRFTEEITAFERPNRLDYRIVEVNAPIVHEGGSILLVADGERTQVHWTSTFTATTPVLGRPFGATARLVFAQGFRAMLGRIEAKHSPDRQPLAAA